ncbi:anthrone oxygenase family protein [Ochrobactrum sp. GPK 3]|uniref:anthrone oxygenase family protein n=1 Tax=Brucella sp. 22210 TaxID=3453892 RepID=UPI00313856CB
MINGITNALLWFLAIGSGLLAGVYFAFSAFIMSALGRIEIPAGIASMNAINNVILRSPFMPLFLTSTLAALILTVIALFQWQQPGSVAIISGGVIYLLGMFICTVAFNVPLNDALAVVDPSSAQGVEVWSHYLRDWTFWNHIRTVASIFSSVLCIYALVIR